MALWNVFILSFCSFPCLTLCLLFSWRIYNVFHFSFVTTGKLFHIKHIVIYFSVICNNNKCCVLVDSAVKHSYKPIILWPLQLFIFHRKHLFNQYVIYSCLWKYHQKSKLCSDLNNSWCLRPWTLHTLQLLFSMKNQILSHYWIQSERFQSSLVVRQVKIPL